MNGYKESKYFFSDVKSWKDPCEKKFLAEKFDKKINLPYIMASCFSNSTADSEDVFEDEKKELKNLLGEGFKADIKKSRLYEP